MGCRYRKSTRYEPGKVTKHYGLADDKIPLRENQAFGVKKEKTADDNVRAALNLWHPFILSTGDIATLARNLFWQGV